MLAGRLAGWTMSSLGGWLAGCPAGWLAGWLKCVKNGTLSTKVRRKRLPLGRKFGSKRQKRVPLARKCFKNAYPQAESRRRIEGRPRGVGVEGVKHANPSSESASKMRTLRQKVGFEASKTRTLHRKVRQKRAHSCRNKGHRPNGTRPAVGVLGSIP